MLNLCIFHTIAYYWSIASFWALRSRSQGTANADHLFCFHCPASGDKHVLHTEPLPSRMWPWVGTGMFTWWVLRYGWVGEGGGNVPWTCTDARCYGTPGICGVGAVGMLTFLGLAHIQDWGIPRAAVEGIPPQNGFISWIRWFTKSIWSLDIVGTVLVDVWFDPWDCRRIGAYNLEAWCTLFGYVYVLNLIMFSGIPQTEVLEVFRRCLDSFITFSTVSMKQLVAHFLP